MAFNDKAPKMQTFLNAFAEKAFGKAVDKCAEQAICVFCHKPVTGFRDSLSRKEYSISGLCQECQDEVFGQ